MRNFNWDTTPMMPVGLEWFALKVRTKAEESVRSALAGRGYEALLPTYVSVRKYSDRLKKVHVPLFPGYVFCKMDRGRRLPVLMTPGVEYAVGFGGRLEPVPEAEMQAIETAMHSGLAVQPWPFLTTGDRVRIATGALAGVDGILVRAQGADRLIVSIEMLQRSLAIEVDRTWVRPTASRAAMHATASVLK